MNERVIYAAKAIRVYLPDLLEDDAHEVDQELYALLSRAQDGEEVYVLIIDLLKSHDATRDWMRQALAGDEEAIRFFGELPGRPSSIPNSTKFVCPVEEDTVWYRRTAGQPIPSCPTHAVKLVRAGDDS